MSKNTNIPRLLLFGATGLLGGSVNTHFINEGWSVTGVTRHESQGENLLSWNPTSDNDDISRLAQTESFDAVCWAQGMNFNDAIENFDVDAHLLMYQANVLFVLRSLKKLMELEKLNTGARLCVISSICNQFYLAKSIQTKQNVILHYKVCASWINFVASE
jgi:nucleoside-diphosphate-sugar epimerase